MIVFQLFAQMLIHPLLQLFLNGHPQLSNVSVGLSTDGGKPCGAALLDEQVIQHLLLLITEGEKELGEKTVCCQLMQLVGTGEDDVKKISLTELTEDLEELRFEKALLLQKFEYAEDAGAEAFRKDIATMEAGLKKLETREQKYSVELDKALTEYAELKAQAADFDPVELYKARQVIRPAQEKAAEQQLEDAMQEKPSLIMLLSAKQETSRLLGEDVEERQARQLIAHKRQEQHRNSISKRKRSDPER